MLQKRMEIFKDVDHFIAKWTFIGFMFHSNVCGEMSRGVLYIVTIAIVGNFAYLD